MSLETLPIRTGSNKIQSFIAEKEGSMPLELLQKVIGSGNGCLRVYSNSVHWVFYIAYETIVYATNSIDCFERLDRHLRRLRHEVPSLPKNISSELRLSFETEFPNFEYLDFPIVPDYQAICYLATESNLEAVHMEKLVARQTQEVLEMFLTLPKIQEHASKIEPIKLNRVFCQLKLESITKVINNRLAVWKSLAPTVRSPYEIPYIASEAKARQYLSPDSVIKLHKTLKGYNFRQLSAIHNQDDLAIAKKLYPLIQNGAIWLREPIAPFNLLPLITQKSTQPNPKIPSALSNDEIHSFTRIIAQEKPAKKIVCIDDSQAMLNEIERLLEGNNFIIHTINDSGKALMKISGFKPDLVLLDVGMPNLDGYQLCTLIRKTSMLKDVPIVMVTGNKGLIDRARAKFVGASDFLAKPFTKDDLLKMAFRYLT